MSLEVHGVGSDGVDAMETMMDERLDMQCRQELDRVGRMNKVRSTPLATSYRGLRNCIKLGGYYLSEPFVVNLAYYASLCICLGTTVDQLLYSKLYVAGLFGHFYF